MAPKSLIRCLPLRLLNPQPYSSIPISRIRFKEYFVFEELNTKLLHFTVALNETHGQRATLFASWYLWDVFNIGHLAVPTSNLHFFASSSLVPAFHELLSVVLGKTGISSGRLQVFQAPKGWEWAQYSLPVMFRSHIQVKFLWWTRRQSRPLQRRIHIWSSFI